MRLQGPWAPRDGTCGHAIRTGSWSKRGCGSRPTGAERWRSLPDREQHRVAQPERICLARGNTDLVRSEEHTSELQSLMRISYAVFCLKKKKTNNVLKDCSQQTEL